MIRDFEITDMNSLVKLMEQHATEAGEGVGTYDDTNLIQEERGQYIYNYRYDEYKNIIENISIFIMTMR